MKLRNIFITLLILLATSLLTIFMYELLTNLDSDNLATVTTQNTNVVINNQISARDFKNVTLDVTSSNSTADFGPQPDKSTVTLVVAVSIGVAAVVVITYIGIAYYLTGQVNNLPVTAIELNTIRQ